MTGPELKGGAMNSQDELCTFIALKVKEGWNDNEIAIYKQVPVKEVWRIRRNVLHIKNYGQKRFCKICKQYRSANLFKGDGKECSYCRHDRGADVYKRSKSENVKRKGPATKLILCLRCDKSFESPVFEDGSYNRLCDACRYIVCQIESASI